MKIIKPIVWAAVLSAGLVLWPGLARADSVLVFAAASMTDSLKQAGAQYESETRRKTEFNFAASNLLALQITQGAPADLFISADEAQMDQLAARHLLVAATRRDLLRNTLVAVALADSPLAVRSAAGLVSDKISRLALADPRAVPAGVYAKRYLEGLGLWAALGPKVLPTGNVRAALQAVVSGEAEAALVYKTDVLKNKKVRILFEVPAKQGPRIVYPVALVAGGPHAVQAKAFLAWLESRKALSLFKTYGFSKP